ncbi:hypothetical protein G7Y79_00069g096300 [Physcia stellaris]|nr:hypothetical protein G7Y79_00069g096300 [Physcia stellaris]
MSVSKIIFICLTLLFSNLVHGFPASENLGMVQYHNSHTNLTDGLVQKAHKPSIISSNFNLKNKILRRYTAIGDGFAAGIGKDYTALEDDPNAECRRSKYAYPQQFVDRFGAALGLTNFNFPACHKSQLGDMNATVRKVDYSLSPLPRVWYDFGQPDLVSISLGADDNQAISKITRECIQPLYNRIDRGHPWVPPPHCTATNQALQTYFYNIESEYTAFFETVKTWNLAPGQKREVYVMGIPKFYGFPNNFDKSHRFDCPFGHRMSDFMHDQPGMHGANDVASVLSTILKRAADKAGVTFVDLEAKFNFHRICDHVKRYVSVNVQVAARQSSMDCSERDYNELWNKLPKSNSWVQESRGEDVFYPNQKGQGVYAEALAEAVFGVKFRHWEDGNHENDTPGDNPEIDTVDVPLEKDCPVQDPQCTPG